MAWDEPGTFERVFGGRRCKLRRYAPSRPSEALHSQAEKYKTTVTLLLDRQDGLEHFVVPEVVLRELAASIGTALGFIDVSFGGRHSFCIRLSDLLAGCDRNRWQLLPLETSVDSANWILAAYLDNPAAILGPRAIRAYTSVPSFVFFDHSGQGESELVLQALACPFDRDELHERFSRSPRPYQAKRPNPVLAKVSYSADENGNVCATFSGPGVEPVINLAAHDLSVLRSFPCQQRYVRLVVAGVAMDCTAPLDEFALPRLSAKSTKQPFYELWLPITRLLPFSTGTQLGLAF